MTKRNIMLASQIALGVITLALKIYVENEYNTQTTHNTVDNMAYKAYNILKERKG